MSVFFAYFSIGPPGAGKSTQLKKIEKGLGIKHLAAGDLIRAEACKKDSIFALTINKCLESGRLIPSEITFSIIEKEINFQLTKQDSISKKKIFIIDGFPRNKENLDLWYKLMSSRASIKGVVVFECKDSICFTRACSRELDRSDDQKELIIKRIKSFNQETLPLIDQFDPEIERIFVNAEKNEEEVYLDLEAKLRQTV